MSARNHAVCPRCMKNAWKAVHAANREVAEAYGKVNRQEFFQLQKKATDLKIAAEVMDETLAEYYDIGVNDVGTFEMNYNCTCEKCGFEYKSETMRHKLKEFERAEAAKEVEAHKVAPSRKQSNT